MNLRQIQELIKFVAKSGATEVDIEIGDVKLSIKSPPKGKVNEANPVITSVPPFNPPHNQPAQPVENIDTTTNIQIDTKNQEKEDKYITIKAPIIGTFYRRPSPDKDAFINVGDKVKEGDVLCIIEAMKLFNEIESEFKGTIVKVLVEDMSPVEYDQPIFLIDPS